MQLQFTKQTEAEETIEITIKGEAEEQGELKGKAIKSLLNSIDPKLDFNEDDFLALQGFVEEMLIAAVDVIGYESYYWENVPDNEKSYNEYDELMVSKKAKIDLLEQIVRDMKARL